jgi:hypothetical protein
MRRVLTAVLLLALAPAAIRAQAPLETKTVRVGPLDVVWETEGPFVKSGEQLLALPSNETVVEVTYDNAERLVTFLREHCENTPGCELTYETETKAVVSATTPSGQTQSIPYTVRTKQAYPGAAQEVRATLTSWENDTFALWVATTEGTYCIPNDYVWSDYSDRAYAVLSGLGKPSTDLKQNVVLTVHPFAEPGDDCKGYLAAVQPVK